MKGMNTIRFLFITMLLFLISFVPVSADDHAGMYQRGPSSQLRDRHDSWGWSGRRRHGGGSRGAVQAATVKRPRIITSRYLRSLAQLSTGLIYVLVGGR